MIYNLKRLYEAEYSLTIPAYSRIRPDLILGKNDNNIPPATSARAVFGSLKSHKKIHN